MHPLVVIPAYNEAQSIGILLERLTNACPEATVLVVDDSATDDTADLIRQRADFERRLFLLHRPGKRGFASACVDGFRWALARDFDCCVEMDADLSHDPADVPRLLAVLGQGTDLVIGSRYLGGVRVLDWPLNRLLISICGGVYVRTLTGLPLTDPTSGFKAFSRAVLESLDWTAFRTEGYGFTVETHFRVLRAGFGLREIPIILTERHAGTSQMSFAIARESARRVAMLGAERLFSPMRVKPKKGQGQC
jgi:dolichol-phosphate mannosyltransferase